MTLFVVGAIFPTKAQADTWAMRKVPVMAPLAQHYMDLGDILGTITDGMVDATITPLGNSWRVTLRAA